MLRRTSVLCCSIRQATPVARSGHRLQPPYFNLVGYINQCNQYNLQRACRLLFNMAAPPPSNACLQQQANVPAGDM